MSETPVVDTVEMVAELTRSWERQTTRIVNAIIAVAIVGVTLVSGINWGVQYRLTHSRAILESTRQSVAQNMQMILTMREDRADQELRYHALMAAIQEVGRAVDRQKGKR